MQCNTVSEDGNHARRRKKKKSSTVICGRPGHFLHFFALLIDHAVPNPEAWNLVSVPEPESRPRSLTSGPGAPPTDYRGPMPLVAHLSRIHPQGSMEADVVLACSLRTTDTE